MSSNLDPAELHDIPEGSIVIDKQERVIALKVTPTRWAISGEQFTADSDMLWFYASEWNVVRTGFTTPFVSFENGTGNVSENSSTNSS